MRRRTGALLAVLGLILVSCGGPAESSGGLDTSIAVHGDWTITVHNADGSLDQKVEFSNALHAEGRQTLSRVLSGESSLVGWHIGLGSQQAQQETNGPCPSLVPAESNPCRIVGSQLAAMGVTYPAANVSDNLSVVRLGQDQVRLSGSFTATQAHPSVGAVETAAYLCPGAGMSSCQGPEKLRFTIGSTQAIVVTLGQVLTVEVLLSFSN